MEFPAAPSRRRSLSWRTGPFLCLAGAATTLLGCMVPHFRLHADTRPYGGTLQSITYDGLETVPDAVILLAVLAVVLTAVSFATDRRLRGGWVVVAIGAGLNVLAEVVAVLRPTDVLMSGLVKGGIDEAVARSLIERGLYSMDAMVGVLFTVAGAIVTFAGAILAIRDRRFRRCELCRATLRVDSYQEHLKADHPTSLVPPQPGQAQSALTQPTHRAYCTDEGGQFIWLCDDCDFRSNDQGQGLAHRFESADAGV